MMTVASAQGNICSVFEDRGTSRRRCCVFTLQIYEVDEVDTKLTRSVFLAPLLLLMMMVPGPPMEQMLFSRAPPHTGTVDTVKSCRDKGGSLG